MGCQHKHAAVTNAPEANGAAGREPARPTPFKVKDRSWYERRGAALRPVPVTTEQSPRCMMRAPPDLVGR
jgi:hypothetical protein